MLFHRGGVYLRESQEGAGGKLLPNPTNWLAKGRVGFGRRGFGLSGGADMVNAVVVGGGMDARLAGRFREASKGLIAIGGKPCAQHVLEAVRATAGVERIALVGPPALVESASGGWARLPARRPAGGAEVRLVEEGSIVAKLLAATAALGSERKLLLVTCDIPLVTPEGLGEVIGRCPEECAFFHPLVEKSAAVREFPEHKWVFLKLREGEVVTTNVFVLDPGWLLRRGDLARELETLRRHPARLALRWGLGFLLKFKLGLLSLAYCEQFFSEFLGGPCRGMICEDTALAMDLDRPEDVGMLERALAAREAGRGGRV